MTIQEIKEKLQSYKKSVLLYQPATAQDLQEVQEEMNFVMSDKLKEFYTSFDGGLMFDKGLCMYSVGLHGNDHTLQEINSSNRPAMLSIPGFLKIIGILENGDVICCDASGSDLITQWDKNSHLSYCCWADINEFLEEKIKEYDEEHYYEK